jgi:hypothetical protein
MLFPPMIVYQTAEYGVDLLGMRDFNPGLHYIFLARQQYCVIFSGTEDIL